MVGIAQGWNSTYVTSVTDGSCTYQLAAGSRQTGTYYPPNGTPSYAEGQAIWFCPRSTRGPTTVRVTYGGRQPNIPNTGNTEMWVYEVSGFNNPIVDAVATLHEQIGTGSPVIDTGASVITTGPGPEFIIGLVTTGDGITVNPASGNEFTAGGSIDAYLNAAVSLITSTAGVHTPVWTDSTPSTHPFNTGTVAFKEAPSAGLTPTPTPVPSATTNPSPTPLSIVTNSLPSGVTGAAYGAALTGDGGTPGYSWGISSGSLPPGLTLLATSGQISGTPITSGSYSFTIRLSDSGSPVQTVTRAYGIAIATQQSSPAPSAETIFSDDFESGNLNKWILGSHPYSIVTSGCHGGSHCAQSTLAIGDCNSYLLWANFGNSSLPADYWTSHWVKFSPGWQFPPAGSGACTNNQAQSANFKLIYNRSSNNLAVAIWDGFGGQSPTFRTYDLTDAGGTQHELFTDNGVFLVDGNWHRLEQHIVQNSSYTLYYDGVQLTPEVIGDLSTTPFVSFGIGVYINPPITANGTVTVDDAAICTARCP